MRRDRGLRLRGVRGAGLADVGLPGWRPGSVRALGGSLPGLGGLHPALPPVFGPCAAVAAAAGGVRRDGHLAADRHCWKVELDRRKDAPDDAPEGAETPASPILPSKDGGRWLCTETCAIYTAGAVVPDGADLQLTCEHPEGGDEHLRGEEGARPERKR